MKDDCIFCKIANGIIPSNTKAANDLAVLIVAKDPMAPHHVLVIPTKHYDSLEELGGLDWADTLDAMFSLVKNYAAYNGLVKTGYRLVINTGLDAGQTVKHLHMHLLGGAYLKNDFGA